MRAKKALYVENTQINFFVFSAIPFWWKALGICTNFLISFTRLDDRKDIQSVEPSWSICIHILKPTPYHELRNNKGQKWIHQDIYT